jgi:Domain of unknown function (DUF4111)
VDVRSYLDAVTARVRSELGSSLTAVTLVGSAGAGWFEPGASDLDVAVVVRRSLERDRARSLAAGLSHSRLPCPARRLELVVYSRGVLADPGPSIPFELNLNTGDGMSDHVGLEPDAEAAHWFLLDLSIARERSMPLYGPPVRSLLGEIPRPLVLDALRTALDWYSTSEPDPASTVLAACRTWHYAEEGEWTSKRDAAEWAATRLDDPRPVHAAVTLRGGGTAEWPSAEQVGGVVARARAALDRA